MGRWLKKYAERAQSSTASADNPDTLATMSGLSVLTHRQFKICKGNGAALEQPKSCTDNADTLGQKSPLDTSVETDAPGKNISDRLGVDPDNPDTVDKKDPKRPQINTDNADNPDTVTPVDGKALAGLATLAPAKDRDPDTGDAIPRELAKLEAPPSEAFTAKLVSFCPKRSPEATSLVDIRCPANSGGMKGLVFKVSQVPGLIRALQQIQAEAVKRGLIEKPVGQ
jgi:hypothetical protein